MTYTGAPTYRTVLVVESDIVGARIVADELRDAGFNVHVTRHESSVDAARELRPDLAVITVDDRPVAGLDTCRELLSSAELPVVVVGTSDDEVDVVVALELGADDYVVRPFRHTEFVTRVAGLCRRSAPSRPLARSRLRAGPVEVDLDLYQVLIRGEPVHLPVKEFKLLVTLVSNVDRVVSRRDLIASAWVEPKNVDRRTLDVHMVRLRQCIELNAEAPRQLLTIRGLGYKLLDVPMAIDT